MNKTKQKNNDMWKFVMGFSPMIVLVVLYPILSIVYKLFSLDANTMSIIGLFVILSSFVAGVIGLFNLKSINKIWRILIFLLYFPVVVYSLLLSGF